MEEREYKFIDNLGRPCKAIFKKEIRASADTLCEQYCPFYNICSNTSSPEERYRTLDMWCTIICNNLSLEYNFYLDDILMGESEKSFYLKYFRPNVEKRSRS